METSLQFILDALPTLLVGATATLRLTAMAVFFGGIGGIALGITRLSKFRLVRLFSRAYVDFFRGTPLLVQLFMVYFGIPAIANSFGLSFKLDRWTAAVIGLSLNSAAYTAEIVRAGIQSINQSQTEAAESLGLSPWQTMVYVVFPQALRRMIPPLSNEFTTLLKDTSLVAVIGYEELFRQGQLIFAKNFRVFEILFAVALIYLAMNAIASQAFALLEKRMDPKRRRRRSLVSTSDTNAPMDSAA